MNHPIPRLSVITALVVSVAALQSGFCGVEVVQQIENAGASGETITMTVRVEGGNARVDVGDEMSTIMEPDGSMTTLMHGAKTAMKMPAAVMEKMKSVMGEQAGAQAPELEPTGKTEEISGYPCVEYSGTVAGRPATYWFTKEIPDQEAVLEQLSKISGDMDPFKGMFKDGDGPGFPIRTIVESPQAGRTVATVVSIEEKEISNDVFGLPEGYKETKMPAIPGF